MEVIIKKTTNSFNNLFVEENNSADFFGFLVFKTIPAIPQTDIGARRMRHIITPTEK